MKLSILAILLIFSVHFIWSCTWEADAHADLVAYSFPAYKEVSQFQYARYSQNDILFLRSFNLTMKTNCSNYTITPKPYIILPTGEKKYLFLDAVPLKSGTFVFPRLNFTDKEIVSYGQPLRLTGDYVFGVDLEVAKQNNEIETGGYVDSGSSSNFLVGAAPGLDFPFTVVDSSNKLKINGDYLFCLSMFVFLLVILFEAYYDYTQGKFKIKMESFWNYIKQIGFSSLKNTSVVLGSLAITLLIIFLFIKISAADNIEVDVFTFIASAATLFVSIFVAFLGLNIANTITKKRGRRSGSGAPIHAQKPPTEKRKMRWQRGGGKS